MVLGAGAKNGEQIAELKHRVTARHQVIQPSDDVNH